MFKFGGEAPKPSVINLMVQELRNYLKRQQYWQILLVFSTLTAKQPDLIPRQIFLLYDHHIVHCISSCITNLEIGCAILQEFIFPEGLSLPLGGEGAAHYVVIEMHYDNPSLEAGKFHCNCMHACKLNPPIA